VKYWLKSDHGVLNTRLEGWNFENSSKNVSVFSGLSLDQQNLLKYDVSLHKGA